MSFTRRNPSSRRAAGAFSKIEILIVVVIIGMLAALVVPQFSSAARTAKESSLRDDLVYLRSQVLLYKAQHGGISPGFPNGDATAAPTNEGFIAQMTLYTDAAGHTSSVPSAAFKYGPYLTAMPENILNGSAAIRFVGETGFARPMGSEGWVYQPATGTVVANVAGIDAGGTPFFDY